MAGITALSTEIIARLGNRSDIDARALTWLNDGYVELLLSPRFAFYELDTSGTFATVSTTRTYSLTSFTTLWFLLTVRDTTNIRRLRQANVREFDEIQHVAGQPTRYARFGATLELDPTPDGAYTIQLRYRKRPDELVIGGSHVLGREWDEVLVALAVLKGREALEQTEQAAAQRQLVEMLLAAREEVYALEDMDSDTTIAQDLQGWGG
jgi:hypothetical protein